MKKQPVLVLNADYQPLEITDWQAALVLVYSKDNDGHGAYVVSTYDQTIKDGLGKVYNLPAVIVIKKYIKNGNKRCPYSKRNVKLRDKNTCQYCGGVFPPDKLNVDHITPRSKQHLLPSGIKCSSFENVVCSCIQCNSKKADRTLKEAGLHLIRVPRAITKSEKVLLEIKSRINIPQEWKPYIDIKE
jgi:5-methylcytosine-specific restriction endonuclease McrA